MQTNSTRAVKRAQTDKAILRSAIRTFGIWGYSNSSLTEIAAEAGVSQGLVSQRFVSKENLFLEAFRCSPVDGFFDTPEKHHMPDALYAILDHLKDEAENDPDWFRFVRLLHNASDLTDGIYAELRKHFYTLPVADALREAQDKGDLPDSDLYSIFKTFFRNAGNMIRYYHDNAMAYPDNRVCLYAIGYDPERNALKQSLEEKTAALAVLQTDRLLLARAVEKIYPLGIFIDLTGNTYRMINYDRFTTKKAERSGCFDELIRVGASTVPDPLQAEQFLSVFSREALLRAFADGKTEVSFHHQQTGDDGVVHWMDTRVIMEQDETGGVRAVSFARSADEEMQRLSKYESSLQEAGADIIAKQRFLSELSHNIRTPMNAVTGYIGIAERNLSDTAKAQSCLQKAQTAAGQLMDLLENAMNYAYAAGPEMQLSLLPANIYEMSASVMLAARKLADQKNIRLKHLFHDMTNYVVWLDEIKVKTVAAEILANAIKFTPENGTVTASCRQVPSEDADYACYEYRVSDNGPGVSKDFLDKVFVPFEKERTYTESGVPGIGIGLALVKECLNAMGATIDFMSTPGKGTTVICRFKFRLKP